MVHIKLKNCLYGLLGSFILAFGLYNIHSMSGVTEGGVLGMTLLLDQWFSISPAISGFVMNMACYALGWKFLGTKFIAYSIVSGSGFSVFYGLLEQTQPLWPSLIYHPLLASILGALFVGVGVGLAVRSGGAPGGDDALAMSLSYVCKCNIEVIYLASDLIVLALSLTYIPIQTIGYSLLTVILSGQLIGVVQRFELDSLPSLPEIIARFQKD